MLNDTDNWPVTCVNCGHIMYEPIGRLKQTVDLTCPHCEVHLKFHRKEFAQSIEQHRMAIEIIAKNNPWVEKKPRLDAPGTARHPRLTDPPVPGVPSRAGCGFARGHHMTQTGAPDRVARLFPLVLVHVKSSRD